jgi:hypothetical protein
MKEQIIEVSKKFWKALEAADTATMRAQCDPKCYFVHIGGYRRRGRLGIWNLR